MLMSVLLDTGGALGRAIMCVRACVRASRHELDDASRHAILAMQSCANHYILPQTRLPLYSSHSPPKVCCASYSQSHALPHPPLPYAPSVPCPPTMPHCTSKSIPASSSFPMFHNSPKQQQFPMSHCAFLQQHFPVFHFASKLQHFPIPHSLSIQVHACQHCPIQALTQSLYGDSTQQTARGFGVGLVWK